MGSALVKSLRNEVLQISTPLISILIRHEQAIDIIGTEAAMTGSPNAVARQQPLLLEAVDRANAHAQALSRFCRGKIDCDLRRSCRRFIGARARLRDATRHGMSPRTRPHRIGAGTLSRRIGPRCRWLWHRSQFADGSLTHGETGRKDHRTAHGRAFRRSRMGTSSVWRDDTQGGWVSARTLSYAVGR